MFVLATGSVYSWPVTVQIASSGGKFDKFTFDLTFKRVTQSRLKDILGAEDMKTLSDAEFCKEIVLGWKGVVDENHAEIPFSMEALDKLLEIPMVAKAIVTAYLESVAGSKPKN